MKILVFADSHGHTKNIINVLGYHPDIEYVIHLGDYGTDVYDIEKFNPLLVTEAVLGNNDKNKVFPLEKVIQLVEKRIFITHGHSYNVGKGLIPILARAAQENADVILYGHTHVPGIEKVGGVLVVNPGSIYRQRVVSGPTYAVLEIARNDVSAKIHHVK